MKNTKINECDSSKIPKDIDYKKFKRYIELHYHCKLPFIDSFKKISHKQKIKFKKYTSKIRRKWIKQILLKELDILEDYKEELNNDEM